MVVGVGIGVLPPSFTTDVVANLLFGIPVMVLPFVLLWNAPGENRTRLDKASELTLFYLPYTAGSQIGYELIFLIGHPIEAVDADRRPRLEMAVVAVRAGRHPLHQHQQLDIRPRDRRRRHRCRHVPGVDPIDPADLPAESRIRCLWLSFAGVAMLMSSTSVYFLSEVGSGFADIGQGAFGLWFKFIGENVPFIVLPAVVLYSIYLQIDYLTRRVGVPDSNVSASADPGFAQQ